MIVFCSDTRQNGIVVVKIRGVRKYIDSICIVTEAVVFRFVSKRDAFWISCVFIKMLRHIMLLTTVLLNSSGRFKQLGVQTH